MTAKHTQLPWKAIPTTSSEFVTRAIYGNDGKTLVAHVGVPGYSKSPKDPHEDVENSNLIVKACNSYEYLLSTLKEARQEIYLAHSKDGAVYDPTILTRIDIMLAAAGWR
jgi:hypothetical protein